MICYFEAKSSQVGRNLLALTLVTRPSVVLNAWVLRSIHSLSVLKERPEETDEFATKSPNRYRSIHQ